MPIIDVLSSGISILDIANTVHGLITGHTFNVKIKNLSNQVEKLSNHIYYISQQEVIDPDFSRQRVIDDLREINNAAKPIQKALDTELVVSKPIKSPERLMENFNRKPEHFLDGITSLKGTNVPMSLLEDKTRIPIIFNIGGEVHIGFIKVGIIEYTLGCEYNPQSQLFLPPTVQSDSAVAKPSFFRRLFNFTKPDETPSLPFSQPKPQVQPKPKTQNVISNYSGIGYTINDECIACGACELECPVNAISEGDPIYIIDPDVCVECEGYHDSPQCAEICPVEACVQN